MIAEGKRIDADWRLIYYLGETLCKVSHTERLGYTLLSSGTNWAYTSCLTVPGKIASGHVCETQTGSTGKGQRDLWDKWFCNVNISGEETFNGHRSSSRWRQEEDDECCHSWHVFSVCAAVSTDCFLKEDDPSSLLQGIPDMFDLLRHVHFPTLSESVSANQAPVVNLHRSLFLVLPITPCPPCNPRPEGSSATTNVWTPGFHPKTYFLNLCKWFTAHWRVESPNSSHLIAINSSTSK